MYHIQTHREKDISIDESHQLRREENTKFLCRVKASVITIKKKMSQIKLNETNSPKLYDNSCADSNINIRKYTNPLYCTLSSISVILHSFAGYLLFKVRHVKANQQILLTNLSLSEILFAFFNILHHALGLKQDDMDTIGRLEWLFYIFT